MARKTLTIDYKELCALKSQAESGKVNPAQLARFLDEMTHLDVSG